MVRVGGSGQRHHADIESEPEHDLADRSAVASGDPGHYGMGQHLAIGREQREALVDQPIDSAELPDAPVPAAHGIATVLNEAGPDARLLTKALELFQGNVANAEQAHPAA